MGISTLGEQRMARHNFDHLLQFFFFKKNIIVAGLRAIYNGVFELMTYWRFKFRDANLGQFIYNRGKYL